MTLQIVDTRGKTVHMYGVSLSARQKQILAFVQAQQVPPTTREIAAHFHVGVGTVADHIQALRVKGYLAPGDRSARGLRVAGSFLTRQHGVCHIPIYGSVPAGFADERHQEAEDCVSVDLQMIGGRPVDQLFALRVTGDSMVGKHILAGDVAILEHGVEPRTGDTVAALIDGESTLKVYQHNRGKPFLRAANPRYPDLWPAHELRVQGVLVALVRRV